MATVEARKRASQKHYRNHRQDYLDYQKAYKRRRRAEAIELYGGKCMCCGESQRKFLAFDHINNDGSEDPRRSRGGRFRGNAWYNYLLNHHPKDIQLLCYNCNSAKAYHGQCPHREETKVIDFDSSFETGQRFFMEEK